LRSKAFPETIGVFAYHLLWWSDTVLAFAGIQELGQIITGNSFLPLDILDSNIHIF
jgi:hypothetical protein